MKSRALLQAVRFAAAVFGLALQGPADGAVGATYHANPATYSRLVPLLMPGDVLELEAGRYEDGLMVRDLHGAPGQPIVIRGPRDGAPAIFAGREGRNTVSIANASYVEFRNLVLDGRGLEVDAVRLDRRSAVAHHITLESLTIVRHGPEQQTVGIATSAPAYFWTIRDNVIVGSGTGLYLGNPDGTAPFVAGVIEGNVIVATTGYNAQIKHQGPRPALSWLPERTARTLIRGNVFSKTASSSTGRMARPNLLLGHFPLAGVGSEDEYHVEQNVFYGNPSESLMQAEGNVVIEGNLFLNPSGNALAIKPHNDVPRRIVVRGNFIAARRFGLHLVGGHPGYVQVTERNEVFAPTTWPLGPMQPLTDLHAASATAALVPWLERAGAEKPHGEPAMLLRALGVACRARPLQTAPPLSVMLASDPACAALVRARPEQ